MSAAAEARDAYDLAVAARDRLIDAPDKSVSVEEYRKQLAAASRAVKRAHRDWLALLAAG